MTMTTTIDRTTNKSWFKPITKVRLQVIGCLYFDREFDILPRSVIRSMIQKYDAVDIERFYTGSFYFTKQPRRSADRVCIDDRFDEVFDIQSLNPDNPKITLYVWETTKNECTRCGICCMLFFCENKNAYHTPISDERWIGRGYNRCINLKFDVETGLYGCASFDKRSLTCEQYRCDHLCGLDSGMASFGKQPIYPMCIYCKRSSLSDVSITMIDGCKDCKKLAASVEWFISFARHRKLSTKHIIYSAKIIDAIERSTDIPGDYKTVLIDALKDIITTRVRKNSHI